MASSTPQAITQAGDYIDPGVVFASTIEQFNQHSPALATGLCPFHPDQQGCLRMNLLTGRYHCDEPTCNAAGGNIVRFMSAYLAVSAAKARRYLVRNYCGDSHGAPATSITNFISLEGGRHDR